MQDIRNNQDEIAGTGPIQFSSVQNAQFHWPQRISAPHLDMTLVTRALHSNSARTQSATTAKL
jgi:hypothetical protein